MKICTVIFSAVLAFNSGSGILRMSAAEAPRLQVIRSGDPGNLPASPDRATLVAQEILALTGITGGMVVHLGAGEGRLTAALQAGEGYTVQGLEADPKLVEQARRRLLTSGNYGPLSIEPYTDSVLPYADNLINLLVVQDESLASYDEWMRVLTPGGTLCQARQGRWEVQRKPWPEDLDEWTHFLHDASNNAVANDAQVGPPRSLQWIVPPLWLRSHETPSGIQAPVTAAGRLFYFLDEGLIGITDELLPDRWSLICRDAFNGKLLWKKKIGTWGWRQWSLKKYQGKDWTRLRAARVDVPGENQRRLVAVGDRLYATLAYQAPLSILDARTGEVLTTVPSTQGAREILVSEGMAVVYVRSVDAEKAQRRGEPGKQAGSLLAVRGQTGEVVWRVEIGRIRPLALAIDRGRIVCLTGKHLVGLSLAKGRELWRVQLSQTALRTLLTVNDVVVWQASNLVAAHDAKDGRLLWEKTVPPIGGAEADDLFVIDGLVWRGMLCVDDQGKPVRKSPHALAIGWDLRTGDEKRRIRVDNLRSPEHHHRCYRNKATSRFLISSYEGAEFLDFQGNNHSQNNWLRGACRHGMMPGNGMLYVPPDQCFCQPGAKVLGYAAVHSGPAHPLAPIPNDQRLIKGPAYGMALKASAVSTEDWPTYRGDAARHGRSHSVLPTEFMPRWKTGIGGVLTPPVAAAGLVYVASKDAHTLHALDLVDGQVKWTFTAQGRIDSPPTYHRGLVLCGSKDGYVYCLRAVDGQMVWRFLAAPCDHRIASFDQFESTWPVHGSVLVDRDIAYFSAGRSTYLDGGIRLYGLDPRTGKILHEGILQGPHPERDNERDVAFYILGANSDVLASEGGHLYMRQKKINHQLEELSAEVLSSKGAQDVGRHLFSTASLLDGSWYNRTFWMYANRWPGFQLANQAPKTGQLLVIDEKKTYGVRAFYQRNVHSPMFFPGTKGYLLFADWNTTEPQIVGEAGARQPVKWLPQSDYSRARGKQIRRLESEAFGLDKMIGYTRGEPPVWMTWLPVRMRALVKAGEVLYAAGPPDLVNPEDPYAAFEGRQGARLVAVSAKNGAVLAESSLEHPPVFDGMIAARGRLLASLRDGSVICLGKTGTSP